MTLAGTSRVLRGFATSGGQHEGVSRRRRVGERSPPSFPGGIEGDRLLCSRSLRHSDHVNVPLRPFVSITLSASWRLYARSTFPGRRLRSVAKLADRRQPGACPQRAWCDHPPDLTAPVRKTGSASVGIDGGSRQYGFAWRRRGVRSRPSRRLCHQRYSWRKQPGCAEGTVGPPTAGIASSSPASDERAAKKAGLASPRPMASLR